MSQSAVSRSPVLAHPDGRVWPSWAVAVLLIGLAVLYVPTWIDLSHTVWQKDESGHGPLVLLMSCWLLWRDRDAILDAATAPAVGAAFCLLILGLLMYVLGRSQVIDTVEVASQIPVLCGAILLVFGWGGLRKVWFALFFMIFMIPLPGVVVQMLTMPLKAAVSYVAEAILYAAHYPIGRSGVTLTIGPYQLLVADACSGLSSLFTLESLGLFYMNLMNYKSKARNVILALLIVPISFVSNVCRVMILVLVTYYLGDEAGQGFLHVFSGLVLFSVALVLTYSLDRLLAARFDVHKGESGSSK